MKRGKRTYGAIYRLPSGREVYLAWRSTDQVFRSGEKDISSAVRKGTACWAIDDETLQMLRRRGIRFVGVLNRKTGDKYLTTIDRFLKEAKVLNYESRGGALQRYLPVGAFSVRVGS